MFSGSKRNDEWEDSLLRATILFNEKKSGYNRDELLLNAFYAVIVHGKGEYTKKQVSDLFKERFELEFDDREITKKLQALKNKGLIEIESVTGKVTAVESTEPGSDFYKALDDETNRILDTILARVESNITTKLSPRDKNQIRENAKSALSAYFHQYGFAYVNLKKQVTDRDKLEDAIKMAKQNLSTKTGDSLIGALCDIILNPNDEEKAVLEKWARAYVTMEILNLDPSLRYFKNTKLREKTFVLDTDFLLHCLCTHTRHSASFRLVCQQLQNIGCKFFLPEVVITEVTRHIGSAVYQHNVEHVEFDDLSDELLRNNVFIEDYVRRKRENPQEADMDFNTYISNIYDNRYPGLLVSKIESAIGDRYEVWVEDDLVDLESVMDKDFAQKIKKITEKSEKGAARSEEQNQDLSDTDARLFLTVKRENEKIPQSGQDNTPFSYYYYLLSMSSKIKGAALEIYRGQDCANCVCHPNALFSILQEIGMTRGEHVEYLNLFENPFLVYTSERVKEAIKPVIKSDQQLKHRDLMKLRCDVEIDFNKMLNGTAEERNEELEKAEKKGYLFAADRQKMEEENRRKDKLIEEQKEELKKLREAVMVEASRDKFLKKISKSFVKKQDSPSGKKKQDRKSFSKKKRK